MLLVSSQHLLAIFIWYDNHTLLHSYTIKHGIRFLYIPFKIHIIKHDTQIPIFSQRRGKLFRIINILPICGKLTATKIRLGETLSLRCSAFKHLIIFHRILIITWLMFDKSLLWSIFYRNKNQLCVNTIAHTLQKQRILLLSFIFNKD